MIVLLAIVLVLYAFDYWPFRRATSKEQEWRGVFKKASQPSVVVAAPTYALAVRALMKKGIDYKELKSVEAL